MWYQVKERRTAVYVCCKEDVPGKGYDSFKIQGQM